MLKNDDLIIEGNNSLFTLEFNWITCGYFIYLVLLYVLAIFIFPQNRSDVFLTYNYFLNINELKLFVSIILSISIWYVVSKKFYKSDSFSTQVLLILILLYFMPGIVIAGALNYEWLYMFEFYTYFVAMLITDTFFINPISSSFNFNEKYCIYLQKIVIIFSLVLPVCLFLYFRSSFSISTILSTLNNPYEVRAEAKELDTRWLVLAIEYWGAYFSCFMIAYSLMKKNFLLTTLYMICNLFYFTLQGNRIFIFCIILAIILGLTRVTNSMLLIGFLLIELFQVLEYMLLSGTGLIGLFTNFFRRYCIVPNILSSQYFDYFQTHSPDWLTGNFANLFSLIGVESEYGNNIGVMIGNAYYGWSMNANNGLFGGAMFEFGTLGVILDPIMFVLVLRLSEKILYQLDYNLKFTVAVVYATLAINLPAFWTGLLAPTPTLLFVLSCMLFSEKNNQEKNEAINI